MQPSLCSLCVDGAAHNLTKSVWSHPLLLKHAFDPTVLRRIDLETSVSMVTGGDNIKYHAVLTMLTSLVAMET